MIVYIQLASMAVLAASGPSNAPALRYPHTEIKFLREQGVPTDKASLLRVVRESRNFMHLLNAMRLLAARDYGPDVAQALGDRMADKELSVRYLAVVLLLANRDQRAVAPALAMLKSQDERLFMHNRLEIGIGLTLLGRWDGYRAVLAAARSSDLADVLDAAPTIPYYKAMPRATEIFSPCIAQIDAHVSRIWARGLHSAAASLAEENAAAAAAIGAARYVPLIQQYRKQFENKVPFDEALAKLRPESSSPDKP